MRSVSDQIVYCRLDNGFIKYYNYKDEVLLEVKESLAKELQIFYQAEYDVRDFVLQTMLRKVKDYSEDEIIWNIIDTSVERLDKKHSSRHGE